MRRQRHGQATRADVPVFWAIALAYSLSALMDIWLLRRGRWKEKVV